MAMDFSSASYPLHNKLKLPPRKPQQAYQGGRGGLVVTNSSALVEDQVQCPPPILAGTTCNLQVPSRPLMVATLACT